MYCNNTFGDSEGHINIVFPVLGYQLLKLIIMQNC